MHNAVAGNTGSSRTTPTTMLTKHDGWRLLFMSVNSNPFLEDYRDFAESIILRSSKYTFTELEVYFYESGDIARKK